MIHQRDIVPHAKTQSVRIEQGPLQRRLRLADVHIDTPKGPVNVVAHHLDAQVARELTLTQLDRARAARAADRQRRPVGEVSDDHAGEAALLAGFGTSRDRLLGAGGESEVFALDDQRVLRLYRQRHEAPQQTIGQLRTLYQSWTACDVGVELPMILEAGERNRRPYSIDRRFSGRAVLTLARPSGAGRTAYGPAQLPRCHRTARRAAEPDAWFRSPDRA